MRKIFLLIMCVSIGLLQADEFIARNCAQNAGSIISIIMGVTVAAVSPPIFTGSLSSQK